ncbi:DUF3793 family protein [Clostridium brassicae]|uniref:DUF3793 family protein n=1 Tax=Clostridium brassicae TaxID=2999072 RepID=A0ABT4D788_9CLOT|nr:DUF3793 family protein [Clostridium brassicae]MCY6957106.1 DUF3793 family protein [Clostridium brassicae]
MSKDLIREFINTIEKQEDKKYLISTIAYSTAPTIAGEKPSSLVVFKNREIKNLYKYWELYKEEIRREIPLEFYELKHNENMVSVLFYNSEELIKILKEDKSIKFLQRFGYTEEMSLKESLNLLSQRYENVCPHEIGIFLGYPVDDVLEFTDCPNKQCLIMGYWKVYHDMEKAKDTFKRYDDAKVKVINLLIQDLDPFRV